MVKTSKKINTLLTFATLFGGSAFFGSSALAAENADIKVEEKKAYENKFKFSGDVTSVSRVGFNINQSRNLNKANFNVPTETFSALKLSLRGGYEFVANEHHLGINLGMMLAGIIGDSTRRDTGGSSLATYIGFYRGVSGKYNFPDGNQNHTRYFMLDIANVSYSYGDYFGIQIGRAPFAYGGWISGYMDGVQVYSKAIPNTTLWAYATNLRGNNAGLFLKDFRYVNGIYDTVTGRSTGYYIFAGGAAVKYQWLDIRPELYAQVARYIMPQINFTVNSNPDFNNQGFNSRTQLVFSYVHNFEDAQRLTSGYNNYRDPNHTIGTGGSALFLRQTFMYDNHYAGAAFLKNFDNPNELIGSYGDPYGFSLWTNSVYYFSGWSNALMRDATNAFVFVGGSYLDKSLSWDITYRYTNAARAYEQSVQILLNYVLKKVYSFKVTFEFYRETTRAGYTLAGVVTPRDVATDRSSMIAYVGYKF